MTNSSIPGALTNQPELSPARGVPMFFGPSERPLFGVHHTPTAGVVRPEGIVLCNTGPQEYRQTHFAYRQLARTLASGGFHVLRFDYSCTGDSSGASHEARLEDWIADIGTAATELRDRAGLRTISLIGLRLGASLALRAATTRGQAFGRLVLWDPVVSGRDYLAELEFAQSRILAEVHYPEDNRRGPDELLGYVVPPVMRDAVSALDLTHGPYARVPVALVCAEPLAAYGKLRVALLEAGVSCSMEQCDDATLAGNSTLVDILLVSQIPRWIRGHFGRRRT